MEVRLLPPEPESAPLTTKPYRRVPWHCLHAGSILGAGGQVPND